MTADATFEGVVVAETARAILFQGHYWEAPLWFPMSQLVMKVTYDEPMEAVIKVRGWLCRKRGVQEFTHYSQEEIERIAE